MSPAFSSTGPHEYGMLDTGDGSLAYGKARTGSSAGRPAGGSVSPDDGTGGPGERHA